MSHDFHPIHNARIRIVNRTKDIFTWKTGEYWRLLLPGVYEVEVSAKGYLPKTQKIHVKNNGTVKRMDFYLQRDFFYHGNHASSKYQPIFALIFTHVVLSIISFIL